MTDDNNLPGNEPGPDVATAQPDTYEGQVADIADLIGDQFDADPPEEEPAEVEAAPKETDEDDDPLGLNDGAEDVENAQEGDDGDGPQEDYAGGRFAADDAKIKMPDGRVISVGELKTHSDTRIKEFQRDYTEKTTALKAKETQVDQRAQSLDEFQEYAAWYAEKFLPPQPKPYDGPKDDYVAFLQWQQKYAEWQEHAQAFQEFKAKTEAEKQQKQQETQQQANERLQAEREALVKAIPVLKDPVKGKQTWEAIRTGAMQHYGLTAEEFDTIGDHRILVGLRDALAYRRIKSKAPEVQAQVQAKPAMKPTRRAPPQAAASKERNARSERLRATGRMDAAVDSLMDFDL